jgi:hypothetical protein
MNCTQNGKIKEGYTDGQQGNLVSLFLFLQSKESRLKIDLE